MMNVKTSVNNSHSPKSRGAGGGGGESQNACRKAYIQCIKKGRKLLYLIQRMQIERFCPNLLPVIQVNN